MLIGRPIFIFSRRLRINQFQRNRCIEFRTASGGFHRATERDRNQNEQPNGCLSKGPEGV